MSDKDEDEHGLERVGLLAMILSAFVMALCVYAIWVNWP
jgi:hypothetical protein